MVAYTHAIGGIRIDSDLSLWIKSGLSIFGNGSAAVTIFFVLSGFVLATSLDNKANHEWQVVIQFLTRRALRIWPAMLFALVGCFSWITLAYEPATFAMATPGYNNTWARPAEWRDIVLDALFIQNFLDPVTWTLQVEMVGALCFVPLWWCCRRSFQTSLLLLVAWLAYFLYTPLYVYARSGFVFMFILGIKVPYGARLIVNLESPHWPTILFVLSFVGCCLVTKWIPETQATCWIIEAIAAYWSIAALAAICPRKKLWVLDNRFIRLIGRISYSFYLWHFPILFILGGYCLTHIEADRLAQWPNLIGSMAFVISTLLTLPLAWMSHRFVELPGIRLARAIQPKRPDD